MRLDGRSWRVRIDKVRLGADEYRVVRPAAVIKHAALHESRFGANLSVDKDAAVEIAAAWWLAARSPRTLIHLPLKASPATCGGWTGERRLDLVLLHHSLGFRPAHWKQVRARLSAGRPHKITLPADALPVFDDEHHVRASHKDNLDRLHWDIAADTMFVVGSRAAYENEAGKIRGLVEDCPSHLAHDPTTHCCAEIDLDPCRPHHYAGLHVECCDDHYLRTGSPATRRSSSASPSTPSSPSTSATSRSVPEPAFSTMAAPRSSSLA
ncbi:hypothetical protein [Saccharothrix violaceirubra]|uniref:Uncharacterized protein n=1 Tax=Saccharothrix violaceirubra TaxID=413306 RepID=A0A7W7WW49_9PSEU|nr:hypothetical protein [Saccharothrix violaceirubra]MBB4966005.1 hypothetical protein [Saccharothrix violaceirubra]